MKQDYHICKLILQPEEHRQVMSSKTGYNILFSGGESFLIEWEGKQLVWEREEILLMQPGQRVVLESRKTTGSTELTWLQLERSLLEQLSDDTTSLVASLEFYPYGCGVIPAGAQTAMLTRHLSHRLLTESRNPGFAGDIMARGILETLLVLVLRACIASNFQKIPQKRSPFMVSDVFLYIHEHLTEKLTLKDLENAFYVSHEHIAREFKRQTGQTIHQHILTMRLERACALLRQGLPVSQIWNQCGFDSYTYFFQAFRRKYGMTPMEYVEQSKKPTE